MSGADPRYRTAPIEARDPGAGFDCGKRELDDYFARHALRNHEAGIGRAYVLRRSETNESALPSVLGYYTLSMANVQPDRVAEVLDAKLPKYPMPVALIGRLAVDRRATGRRLGEALLLDALRRVVDVSSVIGCLGIVVDAKDDDARGFYEAYDFVGLTEGAWPRRMFLPIETARAAFDQER